MSAWFLDSELSTCLDTHVTKECRHKANNYKFLASHPSQRKISCGRAAIIAKSYYHIKGK